MKMRAEQILIAPVMTEKSNMLQQSNNVYVFEVSARANKVLVMSAVKELFRVKPLTCRIVNVHGKKKRVMSKALRGKSGMTSSWKKAYISLKDGETLSLFGE